MEYAIFVPVLIMSIVVHEVAHAWQARREGDTTAEQLGRITLNPIPHLDPIGSVLLPLVLVATQSSMFFGWAKPVPVNPANFREFKAGDIRVSMAGIVSNLLLAVLFTLLGAAVLATGVNDATVIAVRVCEMAVTVNLILAFFNLIPIPPLDGSHVVYHLLPPALAERYRQYGRYGFLLIIAVVFLFRDVLALLLTPVWVLRDLSFWFMGLWI